MILRETFRHDQSLADWPWKHWGRKYNKEMVKIKTNGMDLLYYLQNTNGARALTVLERQKSPIDQKENSPWIQITTWPLDLKGNHTLGYDYAWVWSWGNKWISVPTFSTIKCLLWGWNTLTGINTYNSFWHGDTQILNSLHQWNSKLHSGQDWKQNPSEAQSSTISLPSWIFSACLFEMS